MPSGRQKARYLGLDGTGQYDVDSDATRGKFGSQRGRERLHRTFAANLKEEARRTYGLPGSGDVDDATAIREGSSGFLHQEERAARILCEARFEFRFGSLGKRL